MMLVSMLSLSLAYFPILKIHFSILTSFFTNVFCLYHSCSCFGHDVYKRTLLLGIVMQRFDGSTGCRVYSFARQSHFSRCRVSAEILDWNVLSNGKPKCTCMRYLR